MKTIHLLADQDLVSLYTKGDDKAFEVLLHRYKNRVFTYIYSIVHNRELANDIFQETFCKAIQTIQQEKYTDTGKFLGWINRIAHNLIIDHYRRQHNENTVTGDVTDYEQFNRIRAGEKSMEDTMSNEQVLKDVVRLIDYLPKTQQEVVRMRFFEDMSYKEIAEVTQVSINTALGRLRYALINMRRIASDKKVHLDLH